ncbi:MAG TPA: hypothetical protein VF185_03910 [Patescibacteria group bacterium]
MAFKYQHLLVLIVFGLFLIATLSLAEKSFVELLPSPNFTPNPTVAGVAKTSLCQSVNGLPDTVCTPGAIDPNVTQDNIKTTICVSGYTQTVRPSTTYTNNLKRQQISEYGFTDTNLGSYEEDHLISLELGGSPKDPKNLWPEAYDGVWGARAKDKVENYLHEAVCNGIITLNEAQKAISTDWTQIYKKITP